MATVPRKDQREARERLFHVEARGDAGLGLSGSRGVESGVWIQNTSWTYNQQASPTAKRLEAQPRIVVYSTGAEVGPQLKILDSATY